MSVDESVREDALDEAELDLLEPTAEEAEVTDAPNRAPIRILRGAPTDDEVAAIVAVIAAAAGASADTAVQRPVDMWGRPTFMHRGVSPFSPYAFPHLSHLRE